MSDERERARVLYVRERDDGSGWYDVDIRLADGSLLFLSVEPEQLGPPRAPLANDAGSP